MRELARRAGVSHTPITKTISGETKPSPDVCRGIARALGEPPEDILRRAGHLPPAPPLVNEEKEAGQILRRLPANVRAAVMTMLRGLNGSFALAPALNIIAEPRATYTSTLLEKLLISCARLPPHLQEEALAFVEQLIATTHIKQLPEGKR